MKLGLEASGAVFLSGIGCSYSDTDFSNGAQEDGNVVGDATREDRMRIAMVTDVHMRPEYGAPKGFAQALRRLQSLEHPPELILFGGDAISDALAVDKGRADLEANLWREIVETECTLPIEACIGNHDIWGWNQAESGTNGREDEWGKEFALAIYGLDHRYRRFDRGGWRFIVLDSAQQVGDDYPYPEDHHPYAAELDDEQFQWLSNQLSMCAPEMPILILSHIPFVDNPFPEESLPPGNISKYFHADGAQIRSLLAGYPNVRLCLSGHVHQLASVAIGETLHVISGAVCGGWWGGDANGTEEGFLIVDLYSDGDFALEYLDYGWIPQPL